MLYGFRDGNEWVVIAADDSAELDQFADAPPPALNVVDVDAYTLMVDDTYKGLHRAYRFEAGADTPPIVEIGQARAADVQRNMRTADPDYDDPYATHSKEERTIREISGLTEHDPWDKRTDDEKKKDAEFAAKIQEHKAGKEKPNEKQARVSGDSFAPSKSKGNVGVTDIRGTHDGKGNITITDVIAQKGLWDEREPDKVALVAEPGIYHQVTVVNLMGNTTASLRREFEFAKIAFEPVYEADIAGDEDGGIDAQGLSGISDAVVFWFKTPEEAEDAATHLRDMLVHVGKVAVDKVDQFGVPHNPMRIFSDTFKKLYRVDVHGVDEAGLNSLFEANQALEVDKMIVQRGTFDEDGSTGAWLVSGIQRLALKIDEALRATEPSLVTEVYAVNTENERLVPKGVEVVDTDAEREIGPRPWNDRAAEWYAWTDEERAEEIKKNVKGDEFIYAGSHSPVTGSTVYVTPYSYFKETGEPWDKESLPISHLLPPDLKEQANGHYLSYARDWVTMMFVLGQSNIRESWFFRIYLNNLGQ